jgi:hypothetical protein
MMKRNEMKSKHDLASHPIIYIHMKQTKNLTLSFFILINFYSLIFI